MRLTHGRQSVYNIVGVHDNGPKSEARRAKRGRVRGRGYFPRDQLESRGGGVVCPLNAVRGEARRPGDLELFIGVTRYNLLSNRFSNRLDNMLHRVNGVL